MTSKKPPKGDQGGDFGPPSRWEWNLDNLGFNNTEVEWAEKVADAAWWKIRQKVGTNDVAHVQNDVLFRVWRWLSGRFDSDPHDRATSRAKFFEGVATITIRAILEKIRTNASTASRWQNAGELVESVPGQATSDSNAGFDEVEALRAALLELPDFERSITELVYVHGHSVAECCRMLQIAPHTGYSAIERAISLLEKKLPTDERRESSKRVSQSKPRTTR